MKVSANFELRELVSPEAYEKLGHAAHWLLDPRLIAVVQKIRDLAGKPVTVNDWHVGGQYKQSGFRMPGEGTGAALSQHRFGRAADLKIQGMTPGQGLQLVQGNWAALSALGLSTVEDVSLTPTWLHVDVRLTGHSLLYIPKG
jgi:hypothetical protein